MGRREVGWGAARGADYTLSWPPPTPTPSNCVLCIMNRVQKERVGLGSAVLGIAVPSS